jgi:S-layer homology domain
MTTSKALARVMLLGAVLALVTAAASGQSYGPEAQRLTIGAAEFRLMVNYGGLFLGYDGYISVNPPAESPSSPTRVPFLAPVSLPEGAAIDELCLYANDTDLLDEVHASLVAVKLAPPGEEDAHKDLGRVSSDAALGYRRYCVDMAEVLRGRIDVDEDGTLDDAAYYVEALLPSSSSDLEFASFGGVRITWRRPVSPLPSAPTFADVPDSHPFYQFIEALAASGITGGCGGGNFCPQNALTRGQMAAFLAKALGLHWAY